MKKAALCILFTFLTLFTSCKNPLDEKELIDEGNENLERGEYTRAIMNFRQCVSANPSSSVAYNRMGMAYDYISEFDSAMYCYQRAIEIDPNYAQAWVNLGNSYSNKGSYDDAIDAYQKALDLKPHLARVYYYMGLAYNAKEDKETGLEYIKRSARMTYEKAQQHLRNLGESW